MYPSGVKLIRKYKEGVFDVGDKTPNKPLKKKKQVEKPSVLPSSPSASPVKKPKK